MADSQDKSVKLPIQSWMKSVEEYHCKDVLFDTIESPPLNLGAPLQWRGDTFILNSKIPFLSNIKPSCRKFWPFYYESQFRISFSEVDTSKFLRSGKPADLYGALPKADQDREIVLYIEADHCPPCAKEKGEVFGSYAGYELTHPDGKKERIAIKINEQLLSSAARKRLVLRSFPVLILYRKKNIHQIRQARIWGYQNLTKYRESIAKAEQTIDSPSDPLEVLKGQISAEKQRRNPDHRTIFNLQVELGSLYLEEGETEEGLRLLNEVAQAEKAQPIKKNCNAEDCLQEYIYTAPAFAATRALYNYYRSLEGKFYDNPEFLQLAAKLEIPYQWFSPTYLFHADALYRQDQVNIDRAVQYLRVRWSKDYRHPAGEPPFVWDFEPERIKVFFLGDNRFERKNIVLIDRILMNKEKLRPEVVTLLEEIKTELKKNSTPLRAETKKQNAS